MAEPVLPVRILEPQIHPRAWKSSKFEQLETSTYRSVPATKPRGRTSWRAKSHIAGAKLDHPVVQPEQLQHALGVRG
jgi:hypothetical protein